MVNHQPDLLDSIFAALADPTRRAVLARLSATPELSVTALARPFAMSLPAVLKHLDVLEGAGLVQRHKRGRTVSCRLAPMPLREAQRWLAAYERFWTRPLDALEYGLAQEGEPAIATAAQRLTQRSATPHTFVGFIPRAAPDLSGGDATPSATASADPNPPPDPPPPPGNSPAARSPGRPRRRRSAGSPRGVTARP